VKLIIEHKKNRLLFLNNQRGFVPSWFMEGAIAIAILGIVAAIVIGAYGDYMSKRKVREIAAYGEQATQLLDMYIKQHAVLPDDPSMVGISAKSPLIASISINKPSGEIVVTANFSPLEYHSLIFVPEYNQQVKTWRCISKDIEEKYLPQNCQKEY